MQAAVLIPVKSFVAAKGRLANALEPAERVELARSMAATVIAAAAPLPAWIVCDDDEVEAFAREHGVGVIRRPARGLNRAIHDGIDALRDEGFGRVVIGHGDLPKAKNLAWVADFDGVTIVPDRHGAGTNVMCVPTAAEFTFFYGEGSCALHQDEAKRLGLALRLAPDDELGWDVDTAEDLLPDLANHEESSSVTAAQNPLTPSPFSMRVASRDLPTPERALAIGAHPDDIDFGCGATLAKWAADGCEVSVLVCTDGSKGTWDPNADEAELIATRQQEQRAACRALGATGEVVFLGHPDGELPSTLAERETVALWIRRLRPSVVLGHDPWKRYRLHPDHRHAGWLTTDGVVAARDPKFFPHQDVPHHRPDHILLWEADAPDHVEDVTGWLDTKVGALMLHLSQHETTMHGSSFRDQVEAKLLEAGTAGGVTHAEVFKLIDDL